MVTLLVISLVSRSVSLLFHFAMQMILATLYMLDEQSLYDKAKSSVVRDCIGAGHIKPSGIV